MNFEQKRDTLVRSCRYGLKNFCDGTPNLSLLDDEEVKPQKPCPEYAHCRIRKTSIYDGRKDI